MPIILRNNVGTVEVIGYYQKAVRRFEPNQNADAVLLAQFSNPSFRWMEVELTEEEFLYLETPAGWDNPDRPQTHLLLSEIDYTMVCEGDIRQSATPRRDIPLKLEALKRGEDIGYLILRGKFCGNEIKEASYYIEDGFGKSVALKEFIRLGGRAPLKAFLQVAE